MKSKSVSSEIMILLIGMGVVLFTSTSMYAQSQPIKQLIFTECFEKITISNALKVNIRPSENCMFRIDSSYLSKLSWKVDGNMLSIACKDGSCNHEQTIDIFVPSLTAVDIHGPVSIDITGFESGNYFALNVWGSSVMSVNVKYDKIKISLFNSSRLNISGEVKNLEVLATGSSSVNGYGLLVDGASLTCSKVANVQLTVNGALNVMMSDGAQLHYKGNPVIKRILTSGHNLVMFEG